MFENQDTSDCESENNLEAEALLRLQEDATSHQQSSPEVLIDDDDKQNDDLPATTKKLLEDYKSASGDPKAELFKRLNAFANQLVTDAEKELADRNKLPIHVRENYETSLKIKEALFGPSKEIIPALDRLAVFFQAGSTNELATHYQEKALEVLKTATPKDYVSLAMRASELARRSHSSGNIESGNKYFDEANKFWQQTLSIETPGTSEARGDLDFKNGNYRDAIANYAGQLSFLEQAGKEKASSTPIFNSSLNPRTARLHQKLGDVNLAKGDLDKANIEYERASHCLTNFSERCGNGRPLPEQLTVLTSVLSIEGKRFTEDEKKEGEKVDINPHLREAANIVRQMGILESQLNEIGNLPKENHLYKDDPNLVPFLDKAAKTAYALGNYDDSAAICEQIYKIQTAQKANIDTRIDTLLTTAHQYFRGKHPEKGIESCANAEKIALTEYGKADPRFSMVMKKIAKQYSNEEAYPQAADVLTRLYKLQTDQNKSPEERIETLIQLADQQFLDKNLASAVRSFEQVVQIVGDNKNLYHLLKAPKFAQSVSSITWGIHFRPLEAQAKTSPAASEQYANDLLALSRILNKAADKQYSAEESNKLSIENYTNSIRAINMSLATGIKVNHQMLTAMADMINWRDKFGPNEEPERTIELEILGRELKERLESLWGSNYKDDDPALIPILDNLAQYHKREIFSDKAIPYMQQALSIEKSQGKKVVDLEKRYEQIAFIYTLKQDSLSAINTYKDLLKTVNNQFNNQDNDVSVRALNKLSDLSSGMNTRVGAPLPAKELLKYQQQALQYKEQEIAMATRMNTNKGASYNLASLLSDQGTIQLAMGQKENALKSLQDALQIDNGLLLSPYFIDQIIRASDQPAQAEQLLRRAVEVQKKNNPKDDNTHFIQIDLVKTLAQQEKIDDAVQLLNNMMEAVSMFIKEAETEADPKQYYKQMDHLGSVLENLAPLYEKQKQLDAAEAAFIRLGKVAEDCADNREHYTRAGLTGLVRIYELQGKEAQATKAKEGLAKLPNF